MKFTTESTLFVLLLCCFYSFPTIKARCWIECPKSQRGLLEPVCSLKDDITSISCTKNIYTSSFSTQSISGFNHVTVSIELSTVVRSVSIYNAIGNELKVGASSYNYWVTQLKIHNGNVYIRPDLFNLFSNLKSINLRSVQFHYFPHFSQSNKLLSSLYVDDFAIQGIDEKTIISSRVSGLLNLKYLYLSPNQFTNLAHRTFSGLNALTYLYLRRFHIPNPRLTFSPLTRLKEFHYEASGLTNISFLKQTSALYELIYLSFINNNITAIKSNTFLHYANLKRLFMQNNKISRLESECFNGLRRLIELSLYSNQLKELNVTTFKGLESLEEVHLQHNFITHLSSRMFEYLPNLNTANFNNLPLHCDCASKWMSIIDLTIYDTGCTTPPQYSGKSATNSSIYVNCTQELSYQCFNRSVRCPDGSCCQDTLNSYICVCEEVNHLFVKPLNKCVSYDQITQSQNNATPTCNLATTTTSPTATASSVTATSHAATASPVTATSHAALVLPELVIFLFSQLIMQVALKLFET